MVDTATTENVSQGNVQGQDANAQAAANTNPGDTGDQTNTEKPAGSESGADWKGSIAEDIRSHVEGFKGPDDVVKALIDAKGKVPVVPDKPESYKVEFDKTVEIPKDQVEAVVKAYEPWRGLAKEVGLTQEQFNKLVSADAKLKIDAQKQVAAEYNKGVEGLKSEWKNDFDANLGKAESTTNNLFSKEFVAFLKKTSMNNHPEFVKGMYALSQAVSEDAFTKTNKKPAGPKKDPVTGLGMLDYTSMK